MAVFPRLSEIMERVDNLEYEAVNMLSAVAAQADDGGSRAAGTRVRKQMRMIKQAAREVRNRILEIRSTWSVPAAAPPLDICVIPLHMEVETYAVPRPRGNRRSTVKVQEE